MTTYSDSLISLITDEIAPVGELIEADTDLLLTGAVDSLGVVRIVQWMEDEYDIRIDPTDVTLDNFQTVAAMVAYLEGRIAPAS